MRMAQLFQRNLSVFRTHARFALGTRYTLISALALGLLVVLAAGLSVRLGAHAETYVPGPGPQEEMRPQEELSIAATEGSGIRSPTAPDLPTISAPRSFSFDPGHQIGDAAKTIEAIAVSDLDWDARPDLVSAGGTQLLAWQNPASPFASTWVSQSVATAPAEVYAAALGDLDNDGYPDLVSGHDDAADYELQLWRNDATPFDGLWSGSGSGTPAAPIYTVAVGDLDEDGDLDIASGDGNGQVRVWENDGTPFSGLWPSNIVGTPDDIEVYAVAMGDLENDGDLDLVSLSLSLRYVYPVGFVPLHHLVIWQNSISPFSAAWLSQAIFTSTTTLSDLRLADFDDDGDPDIAAGRAKKTLVWRNPRTPEPPWESPFTHDWPHQEVSEDLAREVGAVAAGDWDVDGDVDLAVGSEASGGGEEVWTWENDGSPFTGLWSGSGIGETEGRDVRDLVEADLDLDGDPDLAAAADARLLAWPNQRISSWDTWTAGKQPTTTLSILSVAMADFDWDGDADIAAATQANGIRVWAGDGGYTWESVSNDLPDSGQWADIAWGQIDAEYGVDLAAASFGEGLGAWLNSEYHVWQSITWGLPATGQYRAVALGHVDHDGLPDLLACGQDKGGTGVGVQIWQGDGYGWDYKAALMDGDDFCDVTCGYVNHDGNLDIVAANCAAKGVRVWQGDGAFTYTASLSPTGTGSYEAVVLGDLNHDGYTDIVAAPQSGGVQVWLGDGGSAWTDKGTVSPTLTVLGLDLGDFERDGYLDLVAGTDGDGVWVWQGDGGSAWTLATAGLTTTGTFQDVAFGHVDDDALLDVVAGSSDGVHVWLAKEPPPGGWKGFQPSGWVTTTAPITCTVQVADVGSGLAVSSAQHRYTADCDAPDPHWTDWAPAACSGITGTTELQTIAATIPLTQDAAVGNCVQFRIWDTGGLTGTSPVYPVRRDTAPPSNPTLSSTTHPPSTWRASRNIRVAWEGASDATSGIRGYSYSLGQGGTGPYPDETIDAWSWSSSAQVQASADGNNWYFRLRTCDEAGHWSGYDSFGPIYADTQPPTNCSIEAPRYADDPTFSVTWSCEDGGSGIESYDVEVREEYEGHSTGFNPWLAGTTETTVDYTGAREFAHYDFCVRARDHAGNLTSPACSFNTYVRLPATNVDLTLWIDDAGPDVVVDKLIPDAYGPASGNWVDVVVRLEPDEPIADSMWLTLHRPSVLGDPVSRRMYTDPYRLDGGTDLALGGGSDGTTSVQLLSLPGTRYVAFRFGIPAGAAVADYRLWADVSGTHATGNSNSVYLRLVNWVRALILTNRTRLFQEFSCNPDGVLSLLHTMYGLLPEYPRVVCYVDEFSGLAKTWSPASVTYWTAGTNAVADTVDDLIEDWADDGTGRPPYLLLVGDDPIIPYYRVNDPTGAENDSPYSFHYILDPLTQSDGFFSDARYADLNDRNWKHRPTDLAVGRIVGMTPDDMITFMQSGTAGPDVSNRHFVGASWAGINFDHEYDVHGPLRDFGFDILYDGRGESLDIIDDWNTWHRDDLVGAMKQGFAAMGYCGHGEHNLITTPSGGAISSSDIYSISIEGANLDHNHPIFSFSSCRDGFSLANWRDDSMVYVLAHEGASAVMASAGIMWFQKTVGGVEYDGWGEVLPQLFWRKLLRDDSDTAGLALSRAKQSYDEGVYWDDKDEKTIMEYTLFGLPWVRLPRIPGYRVAGTESGTPPDPLLSPAFGLPQATGQEGTYALHTEVDASSCAVSTATVPGFDLLQVTGMGQSEDPDVPVLPLTSLTLTLPADASVLSVSVTLTSSVTISDVNVPMMVPGIPLEGAPQGGFEEVPSDAGVYPSQPYTYRVTPGDGFQRVNFYLLPAAYDPAADQATLYQSMALSVTYQVTYPVVLDRIHATQVPQPPDQPVVLQGVVMNVGSEPITVTPQIDLDDLMGHTYGPQASPDVSVPPGGAAWMTASFSQSGDLPDGPYVAHMTLWEGPTLWAETFVDVSVAGGQITRLRGPKIIWPGETAAFTLTFRNHRSEAVSVVPWVAVSDLDGTGVASLSGVTQTVPARAETTFTLTWSDIPHVQGRLVARAWAGQVLADAIGEVYGPATWFMDAPRWIYLPLVLRGYPGTMTQAHRWQR